MCLPKGKTWECVKNTDPNLLTARPPSPGLITHLPNLQLSQASRPGTRWGRILVRDTGQGHLCQEAFLISPLLSERAQLPCLAQPRPLCHQPTPSTPPSTLQGPLSEHGPDLWSKLIGEAWAGRSVQHSGFYPGSEAEAKP